MKKEQILKEIKSLLKFSSEVAEAEKTFISAVSGDVTIKTDGEAFEEGKVVYVETEDGDVLAPAGEHELEDGTKIVLDENSVIISVEKAEEVEEPSTEPVEAFEEETSEEVVEENVVENVEEVNYDEQINSINTRMEEIENLIKELISKNDETSKFSKDMAAILQNFVEEMPADLEFKSLKSESNGDKKPIDNKFSNLEAIRNLRSKK